MKNLRMLPFLKSCRRQKQEMPTVSKFARGGHKSKLKLFAEEITAFESQFRDRMKNMANSPLRALETVLLFGM